MKLFAAIALCASCSPITCDLSRVPARVASGELELAYLTAIPVAQVTGEPICNGRDSTDAHVLGCFYPSGPRIEVALARWGAARPWLYCDEVEAVTEHEYRHALQWIYGRALTEEGI